MNSETDPLELDAETMRRMGYDVVDYLVQRISGLAAEPAWRAARRADIEPPLRMEPNAPRPFPELLQQLRDDVFAYGARVDHPRFMAFVPGSPTWPGVLGDMIAAAHQSFAGTWLGGAGVAALELVVLDWFRTWLGLPASASGLLLSGGSAANLTALSLARSNRLGERHANGTVYFSSEAHSSVPRACRVLGIPSAHVRAVPCDDDHRIRLDALQAMIAEDRAHGRDPFMLIANAGTTSTGAIDPLHDLANLARNEGLWYHIDAAYGGFAVLTERGRNWLSGIDTADSITLDPHKWLYQPFEVGCLLVRDAQLLRRAFHVMPDYLQDTAVQGEEVNFGERGIQLTRSARAVKVWLSLQYFGLPAFRAAIDHTLDLALEAEAWIRRSEKLELLTPARLGIVCFRRAAENEDFDALNERLLRELMQSGEAMLSSTRVNGRFAQRLCILNHRTSWSDVQAVLEWLER